MLNRLIPFALFFSQSIFAATLPITGPSPIKALHPQFKIAYAEEVPRKNFYWCYAEMTVEGFNDTDWGCPTMMSFVFDEQSKVTRLKVVSDPKNRVLEPAYTATFFLGSTSSKQQPCTIYSDFEFEFQDGTKRYRAEDLGEGKGRWVLR